MRPQRYVSIADQLAQELAANPRMRVGRIEELAARFSVCYVTMHKAVGLLVERGMLTCVRGRGIRVVRKGETIEPTNVSPEQRLFESLKGAIVDGAFHVGRPMYKAEYLAMKERVSRQTIAGTMRLLAAEKLIHKKGRQWIVGPPTHSWSTQYAQAGAGKLPTVLLVMPTSPDATGYYSNPHLSPFSTQYNVELSTAGICQSVLTVFDTPQGYPVTREHCARIRQSARAMGDSYQGAVLHFGPVLGELEDLVAAFCSLGKPVVFFDSTGNGLAYDRRVVPKRLMPKARNLFRLYLDEPAAVAVALERLARAGHTRIGFPNILGGQVDWARARIESAVRQAARMDPAPRIITVDHHEDFWAPYGEAGIPPFSARIARVTGADPGDGGLGGSVGSRVLLEHTPSLRRLLDQGVTAVIAVNDFMAIEYLKWFRAAGIRVPEDISLLSFGNIPESVAYPITTVDLGFPRLGYLAAHIFIGDVPIRADKNGLIPGVCVCMERGSVAAPAG